MRPINWQLTPRTGVKRLRACLNRAGAYREWSEDGVPHAHPRVLQIVCTYDSEDAARDAYESQDLFDVAGEDWPNYEPDGDEQIQTLAASALVSLEANDAEIACGLGDADPLCAVWDFRARYGQVITTVEFVTSGGGISAEAMRELLQSIEREILQR
jgi:hypothetical protein